jgi:abhydrolase domain-containing protein 12
VLVHKFSTISLISDITCPLLLIHGEDDFDISISHSQHLFDAALEPYLEPYPFSRKELTQIRMATEEQQQIVEEVATKRRYQRDQLVQELSIAGLGKSLKFERPGKGAVNFLRSTWGGHNQIVNYEGVMDATRQFFSL